jgi:hypothetical protein
LEDLDRLFSILRQLYEFLRHPEFEKHVLHADKLKLVIIDHQHLDLSKDWVLADLGSA